MRNSRSVVGRGSFGRFKPIVVDQFGHCRCNQLRYKRYVVVIIIVIIVMVVMMSSC
jgi:hypothetical protein